MLYKPTQMHNAVSDVVLQQEEHVYFLFWESVDFLNAPLLCSSVKECLEKKITNVGHQVLTTASIPKHLTWFTCRADNSATGQGSNLLPFRLSGKGKNCGGKAKVGGRVSAGKVPF